MRVIRALVLIAAGCSGGGATLVLEGPAEVRVDRLGPVDPPAVALSDGGLPGEVAWSVDAAHAGVARVEGGRVLAVGEGAAPVVGAWEGRSVTWTLHVEPALELSFGDVPAWIPVGGRAALQVSVKRGGEPAEPQGLVFTSSHPDIATVSAAGEVAAVAPGVAWITAESGESSAMAEIVVREP